VTIQTELRDLDAVRAACKRLSLAEPVFSEHHDLFNGQQAAGWAVKLSGWLFPVVIDDKTGKVAFDNFGGSWGDAKHLDAFKQAYAVCKATAIARAKGYQVAEHKLADGTVRLAVTGGNWR
jgi:hypothetical protein